MTTVRAEGDVDQGERRPATTQGGHPRVTLDLSSEADR